MVTACIVEAANGFKGLKLCSVFTEPTSAIFFLKTALWRFMGILLTDTAGRQSTQVTYYEHQTF